MPSEINQTSMRKRFIFFFIVSCSLMVDDLSFTFHSPVVSYLFICIYVAINWETRLAWIAKETLDTHNKTELPFKDFQTKSCL